MNHHVLKRQLFNRSRSQGPGGARHQKWCRLGEKSRGNLMGIIVIDYDLLWL